MSMQKRHLAAVVQARMTSTRLPGKILLLSAGKPLLEHLLLRLQAAKNLDAVIVATTSNDVDDPICKLCERLQIPYHRGSENNVLQRYQETIEKYALTDVMRITSDCPLHDPKLIDDFVTAYWQAQCDYFSNTLVRTFPHGYDMELFAAKQLFTFDAMTAETRIQEHVTFGFYTNPMRYKLKQFTREHDYWKIRLTVDTKNDFDVVNQIFTALYPDNPLFGYLEVVDYLRRHPQVAQLNQSIIQKLV